MIGVCFIVEDFKFLDELPKIDPQLLAKIEKEKERQLEREREKQKEKEREERKQRAEERAKRKAEKARLLELERERLNDPEYYYDSEYEDSDEEAAKDGEKKEDTDQAPASEETKPAEENGKEETKPQEEQVKPQEEQVKPQEEQVKPQEEGQKPAEVESLSPKKELSSPAKKNGEQEKEEEKETAEERAINEKIKFTKWIMNDPYGPISGQIMSAAKEACLESFMGADPRLVEGVYLCYLQVPVDQIGPVYDVLNRRRSTVVQEEVNEMNYLTLINAHLPVQESFGFYSEMWRKTSGVVNPQLEFDTWRIIEEDPFYIPETEEEMEEWGETGIVHNFAKNLILKIRRRKGLQTEEKLVAAAEKQRTLAKKK